MMFNNFYNGKNVLITGHTGFKGTWLASWLLKLGANVIGFSDQVPTKPSHFEALNLKDKIKDYRGDIRNFLDIKNVFDNEKIDILFHLAAMPIVKECYEKPLSALTTNVIGSSNLLECVRQDKNIISAVFITSDKCYDNVEWNYGYRETDRLGGKDPYSASKACAELAYRTYFESYLKNLPVKTATARAGNVIGGGDWAKDRIVPDCIKAWSNNESVTIRNPNATRPWQLVLEPISGYLVLGWQLIESKLNLDGESFNFGPRAEEVRSVNALMIELRKVWQNSKYEYIEKIDEDFKEANLLKLCCDKALSLLNWQATHSFSTTVLETANWYQAFYQNDTNIWELTADTISRFEKEFMKRQSN